MTMRRRLSSQWGIPALGKTWSERTARQEKGVVSGVHCDALDTQS